MLIPIVLLLIQNKLLDQFELVNNLGIDLVDQSNLEIKLMDQPCSPAAILAEGIKLVIQIKLVT